MADSEEVFSVAVTAGIDDSQLRHYSADKGAGGHVERRVPRCHAFRGDVLSKYTIKKVVFGNVIVRYTYVVNSVAGLSSTNIDDPLAKERSNEVVGTAVKKGTPWYFAAIANW